MVYGIGRLSEADVLAVFYAGVGFTEEEHRAREQEKARRNPELALITAKRAAELAKFQRFKQIEVRFGKAIALIDVNGWDLEKMKPGAVEAVREHGKNIVWLSFAGCTLPPKFGFLIAEFFPNLQALNVTNTNFNDDDVAFVTNRAFMPALKQLNIFATHVTQYSQQSYQF